MNIPCPFCEETILRIREIEKGVYAKHVDDPGIQHDDGRYIVQCQNPKCQQKVILEQVTGGPSGVQFRFKRGE